MKIKSIFKTILTIVFVACGTCNLALSAGYTFNDMIYSDGQVIQKPGGWYGFNYIRSIPPQVTTTISSSDACNGGPQDVIHNYYPYGTKLESYDIPTYQNPNDCDVHYYKVIFYTGPRCYCTPYSNPLNENYCDPPQHPNFYDSETVNWTMCCGISIASFDVTKKSTNSYLLFGTIADTYSSPHKWTLEIMGRYYTGTGSSVMASWDGKDSKGNTVAAGTYSATLYALTGGCVVSKTINIQVDNTCDLKIDTLTGSSNMLDPISGGSVGVNGSISDSSGQTIFWTLSVLDKTFNGTGTSVNAIWDGKHADGTIVSPGSYSATLSAHTVDGQCTDSKTANFTVIEAPPSQCGLYVNFGSSAHIASGNLSHSQELFSTRSGAMPVGMTLYYNSLDPFNGTLGRGWSHNYDYSLKEFSDGSVLISEGDWKYRYYTLSNGAYIAQSGNYDLLAKNGDSTFLLAQKDGTTFRFNTKPLTVNGGSFTVVPPAGDSGASQCGDTTRDAETNTRDEAPTRDGDRGGDPDPIPREEPPPIVPTPRYPVAEGKIVSITDRNGNTDTFTYNGNNLASVTDPSGRTVSFVYDNANHLTSITDPTGNAYTFSVAGNTLASVTQPDSGVWQYTYDANAYMLTKTDPLGNITSYAYDDKHRVVSSSDPEGKEQEHHLSPDNRHR